MSTEIFYFYKTENLINGKYYYGVHKTEEGKTDSYLGSGLYLQRAIAKHGKENFKKTILKYFNSIEEMFSYERAFIDREFLKLNERNCYNIAIGGKGGQRRPFSLGRKASEEEKLQRSERMKLWAKENPDKMDAFQKAGTKALTGKKISEETSLRLSESLKSFYASKDSLYRKKAAENMIKASEGRRFTSENSSGYRNLDFQKRWKPLYDSYRKIVVELLLHSNLPDELICKIVFPVGVKSKRVINYYISEGYLSEPVKEDKRPREVSDKLNIRTGHFDGGSVKTYFKETCLKYNFVFKFDDYLEDLQAVKLISKDLSVSDSMILQGKNYLPLYRHKVAYFKTLGIIIDEEKKIVEGVSGERKRKAPKTVYTFAVPKSEKYILVDKEFNTYGIDETGRCFQKSKFELGDYESWGQR